MKIKSFLSVWAGLALCCACNTIPEDIQDLPSQYVTYNDSIQVHYKSWGQGPETVVFVHGFGCDMNAWEAQYDAFKQEKALRLVFVDMPGYGQSGKPHVDYTLDFLGGGILSVLNELHVDFASLVGHSLGTPVCRQLKLKNPSRIAGVIQLEQPEVVNQRINTLRQNIKQNNLEDYEFIIHEIEQNYAGFPYKVTDANRAEYEQIKQEYRDSIAAGAMCGAYGASEMCCYMQDFHLGIPFKIWSNRFPMNWANYGQQLKYEPKPVAQKLNDQTFLLRFPTCMGDEAYVKWVWDAVEQYRKSGCEQLIVDIRGNGGGSDGQYYPILSILYQQPGVTDGIQMRNTQENRDRLRTEVQGNEYWLNLIDKAEFAKDSAYYTLFANEPHTMEKVDPRRPKKAAIIIDRSVGSSGEQLLLDVRSVAPDVKIYGKDNSLGCIDISNVITIPMPHAPYNLFLPVTISNRVVEGHNLIDGVGIEPDVRINLELPDSLTDNVDSWVLWVEKQL